MLRDKGYCGLGRAVSDLGIGSTDPIEVDCVVISITFSHLSTGCGAAEFIFIFLLQYLPLKLTVCVFTDCLAWIRKL